MSYFETIRIHGKGEKGFFYEEWKKGDSSLTAINKFFDYLVKKVKETHFWANFLILIRDWPIQQKTLPKENNFDEIRR